MAVPPPRGRLPFQVLVFLCCVPLPPCLVRESRRGRRHPSAFPLRGGAPMLSFQSLRRPGVWQTDAWVPVGVVLVVPGDVGLPRRLLLAVSPAVLSLLALFLSAADVWTDVSALQLRWLQGVAARVETGSGR